jgi:diguanylate cyclase (GGDEF)-like protein
MARYKLHVRVGILISALSLLFIFTFTSIQLNNHLERLNSYNKYRARLSTIIVKTTLEMLAKDVPSEEGLSGIFAAAIGSFSVEGVVEKMSIFSLDGKVIATNDPVVREFGEVSQDIERYSDLSAKSGQESWFYSAVNQKTKVIDIYIPLATGAVKKYIVKLSFSIGNISQAIVDTLVPIALTSIAVILGNLVLGFILLKTVVWPIEVLNAATKEIASGNLDLKVSIDTRDEIQELGDTFNEMTAALRKMKEKAENANPLTKLPGNNAIRDEIESRIKKRSKFVAVHVDLDNFKAYNDRYGIAKGDEVIKFTALVLENAVREKGNTSDFIGHEGGDDFFLITTPDKANDVTASVISGFDGKIKDFYSEEDRKNGYISEKDRRGENVRFPIMTISMAGVTNQNRAISSYGELTNIAVGVKHKAKEEKRSNFVLDRRAG